MVLNFYLSSHGTTHLYNLFIDKDRNPPVYPIEGIPDGVKVEIHYKIKGDQMQSVQAQRESLSKMTKLSNPGNNAFDESVYNDYIVIYATGRKRIGGIIKKVEIFKNGKSHVFYDPEKSIIENVPNIEYSYEEDIFTSGLLELQDVKSPIDDQLKRELEELDRIFDKKRKGKRGKVKGRGKLKRRSKLKEGGGGKLEAVLRYEGKSQIMDDYDEDDEDIHLKADQKVEIIKQGCDEEEASRLTTPDDYLSIRFKEKGKYKKHCIHRSFIKPKFYTGSAWDTRTIGFLHSSRPESWTEMKIDGETISSPEELYEDGVYEQGCFKDQSFLNMLFGGGKKNWDPSLYLDFPGCGKRLNKDEVNIINIYSSHCLNPEGYEEHLSFGNVIPFILGKPGLWAYLFKDQLLKGAKEEIEYQTDLFNSADHDNKTPENQQKIQDIEYKIHMARKAFETMKQINKKNLGPVLYENRKRRKTARKKKKNTKRK
tara:strand:- start:784 stop:2232 length:1449 start_codon:yes stop_codon:yes gene_type:complete